MRNSPQIIDRGSALSRSAPEATPKPWAGSMGESPGVPVHRSSPYSLFGRRPPPCCSVCDQPLGPAPNRCQDCHSARHKACKATPSSCCEQLPTKTRGAEAIALAGADPRLPPTRIERRRVRGQRSLHRILDFLSISIDRVVSDPHASRDVRRLYRVHRCSQRLSAERAAAREQEA